MLGGLWKCTYDLSVTDPLGSQQWDIPQSTFIAYPVEMLVVGLRLVGVQHNVARLKTQLILVNDDMTIISYDVAVRNCHVALA